MEKKKNEGGKYLEKENIFFVEEKRNKEEKGGKHLEKENICLWRIEKEKEKNIWRGNLFVDAYCPAQEISFHFLKDG